MKILDGNKKNFYNELDKIINKRKTIDRPTLRTVEKIINNVRKKKDKALIYYEHKFNNNLKIIPSKKEIQKSIDLLDLKLKKLLTKLIKE